MQFLLYNFFVPGDDSRVGFLNVLFPTKKKAIKIPSDMSYK